jgi:hypothetical protein
MPNSVLTLSSLVLFNGPNSGVSIDQSTADYYFAAQFSAGNYVTGGIPCVFPVGAGKVVAPFAPVEVRAFSYASPNSGYNYRYNPGVTVLQGGLAARFASAGNYALLGGSGITNSGNTTVAGGNIGSSPTATITGFPPGVLSFPSVVDNVDAAQAQIDSTAAYTYFSTLPATQSVGAAADLSVNGVAGSNRYLAGVVNGSSSLAMSTGIVLDGAGNPNSIFVFQAGSTVNLASGQSVTFINRAKPSNLVWTVGSSATTVASSNMAGNILAQTSITLGGGSLIGRALAQSGAVTISTATAVSAPSLADVPAVAASQQSGFLQIFAPGGAEATGGAAVPAAVLADIITMIAKFVR